MSEGQYDDTIVLYDEDGERVWLHPLVHLTDEEVKQHVTEAEVEDRS